MSIEHALALDDHRRRRARAPHVHEQAVNPVTLAPT
jgi:hypothetical protein